MHPRDSILLINLLIASSLAISLSDPRTSPAALICSNRTADPLHREQFVSNFLSVLDAVTPQIAARRFARASAGNSTNTSVFAFGECLRDLSDSDCDLCFATCKTMILRCLPFQKATRAGRNFLDGCYLRYEDHDFSGEILSADDRILCGNTSVVNQTEFSGIAAEIISNLSSAADTGGFAVGSTERGNSRVYGLAQCWEYMNASACRVCLKAAAENLSFCVPMAEGRALYSGCYMRYSTAKFFRSPEEIGAVKKRGGESTAVVVAAVFSTVAALAIISLLVFFFTRTWKKRRRVERLLGNLGEAVNKSKLNLEYGILERATNYFDVSNKLGQGGSGSVYKGVLPDGRTVAVKRLVFNTNQWADQFFSEVNLLSKLKHHNLVPLLGCSITGPESLLVYEYLPNHSLLLHLSDQVKSRHLRWPARCQILLGIAEGLAYLHEGSPLKIIHRDIKLSNILLDEQFNAKIADFGLARLLPDENTHLSTAIAGTLGYMAPEYLVRGKLTEKADVYSFGIVILETVCGRSRAAENAPPDPLSLLQNIWKLYTLGRLREAVDPCLEGEFEEDGAVRVLRIGLLCAQAAPELRPAMSEAAGMLRGEEGVADPAPPPFLRFAASGSCSSPAPFCSEGSSVNSTTMSEVFPR